MSYIAPRIAIDKSMKSRCNIHSHTYSIVNSNPSQTFLLAQLLNFVCAILPVLIIASRRVAFFALLNLRGRSRNALIISLLPAIAATAACWLCVPDLSVDTISLTSLLQKESATYGTKSSAKSVSLFVLFLHVYSNMKNELCNSARLSPYALSLGVVYYYVIHL